MNNESFWDSFLQNISSKLNSISFNTWFADSKLKTMDTSNITIEIPNKFKKDFVVSKYFEVIEDTILSITGKSYNINITCPEENQIVYETKKEEVNLLIDTSYREINSNLNKNLTFDNFMVGDSNRFAQTTALAVAEAPGKLYNPYFIYGNSGLGKTHLMHAIGNYIVENSNKTVLYVTAEQFLNDFMQITKKNENNYELIDHFKDKYRNVDVLMIDDIQMMGNAPMTQAEFFNTFESLHSDNKQIILSSDRSPDDLKMFEDRLKTRFHWGLTVTILPTDYDLKIKILKSKLSEYEFSKQIKPEVLDYIANNFQSDVRHLEGAIRRLYACISMFTPTEVNLEFAQENLKDMVSSSMYMTNNISKIQKAVAEYYDLTVDSLKSKKRVAQINNARQVAMYICKMNTDETIEKIGLEFNRDHATVIHACDKIEQEYKKNEDLRRQIKEIKDKIGS